MNILFNKEQLSDHKFSLEKEIILANNKDTYCNTSIIGCNTRKYHGLLVAPQTLMDPARYVMLSSIDETVIQGGNQIKLSTHKYPNTFYPSGYMYIDQFSYIQTPEWIFRINDIVLKKEMALVQNEERVLMRYTVMESAQPFEIWFE